MNKLVVMLILISAVAMTVSMIRATKQTAKFQLIVSLK
jgi:hypothetical protein